MEWYGAGGSFSGNIINLNPELIDPDNGNFRAQGVAAAYGCQVFSSNKHDFNDVISIEKRELNDPFFSRVDIISVSGNISDDTTWNADTVKVDGSLTIDNSVTLTITAGTRVEFEQHKFMEVNGRILAEGTSDQFISFTVNDTTGFAAVNGTQGGWQGIIFNETPSANDSSFFSYCMFEYGKKVPEVNNDHGLRNRGGILSVSDFSKLRINNCIFRHNIADLGGAIYLHKNASIIVSGNLFYKNTAVTNGSVMTISYSYPQITNNTIVDNRLLNEDVFDEKLSTVYNFISKPLFSGNIIRNNPNIMDQQLAFNKLFYTSYNNISNISGGIGNIDDDPLFVDEDHFDYQLAAGSSCVNVGNPALSAFFVSEDDLAGNSRIIDDHIDMGAYEYDDGSDIGPMDNITAHDYQLYQNYPNPFNPTTKISYALKNAAFVNVVVLNVKGENVWETGNRRQETGNYSVKFNGSGLNSGVYYYSLEVDGTVKQTRKMILLK